jgi:hypothetical protein
MKQQYQFFLSKPEVQFWVPILIYAISLTGAYFGLKSDIRAISDEIKFHEATTQEYVTKTQNLTNAVNNVEHDLTILKTIHDLK